MWPFRTIYSKKDWSFHNSTLLSFRDGFFITGYGLRIILKHKRKKNKIKVIRINKCETKEQLFDNLFIKTGITINKDFPDKLVLPE